jgi:uncharacterized protein (DUF433 family)
MTTTSCEDNGTSSRLAREWLSLLEAIVLAEVPEKRVRKDIETGLFPKRRVVRMDNRRVCFRWIDVFALAAAYGSRNLNGKMRKLVLDKVDGLGCWSSFNFDIWCSAHHGDLKPIHVDSWLYIDVNRVCENVRPRVALYAHGLERIEEKAGVLGGEAVFKNTRISTRHIGSLFRKGETLRNILEDYPALTESDVHFADLYSRAHPIAGRPRTRGEVGDVLGTG